MTGRTRIGRRLVALSPAQVADVERARRAAKWLVVDLRSIYRTNHSSQDERIARASREAARFALRALRPLWSFEEWKEGRS